MRKKRQRELEITENYENYIDQSTSEQILQQQDDQELYMVDRIGSKNSRKKIQKNESIKENMNNILSKVEMKLIQKKLKSSNSSTKQNNTKNTINDIWEEDEIENNKNNKKRNQIHQTKALKIPIAGISYNPSHIDHQDAVAEAVALVIKHEEERVRQKIGYDQAPLNAVGTTDLDNNHNSDSESEDESSQNKTSLLPKKQPERKTRAQRNKEKNRSKRQYELIQKQKEKKFLKSIHQVPKLVKEIEKEETEQEIKRNALQNLIKQTKEEEQNQLTYREAGVIPLSDELHGNLRQIKPKGLPVREQVNSMIKSGDMMAKGRRKRRKGENPHAGKRVKWIPKYKYGI